MLCANRYAICLQKLKMALARRLRLPPWELSRKKSLRTIVNCCYGDHKLVMCLTHRLQLNTVSVHHRGVSACHTLTIKKQLFRFLSIALTISTRSERDKLIYRLINTTAY